MTLIEWHYSVQGERDEDNSRIQNTPPGEWIIQQFKIKVEGDRLNVTSESYVVPDAAQIELDEILASWEKKLFLDGSRIKFTLDAIKQYDENGNPVDVNIFMPTATGFAKALPIAEQLPDPPLEVMKDTPDTQSMISALKKFQDEEDNVCTHAYHILTIIEGTCNKNKYNLKNRYKISENVMKDLSHKANKEDPVYGRKALPRGGPLTDEDISWLRKHVPLVGLRFLEVEHGMDVNTLSMIDKSTTG